MPSSLDDRLAALAGVDAAPALDGLEDVVWAKVKARKDAAASGSVGVRAALTIAALGAGIAFGALQHAPAAAKPVLTEMGVLSEDGLLAPSVRLGGGA